MTSTADLKQIKLLSGDTGDDFMKIWPADKSCLIPMDWKGCHLLWIRSLEFSAS